MGSTFQIDGIEDDSKNPEIKRIKLTARDFNVTLLNEMKAKVKQLSQASLSILLIRYLMELGEDRVCKRYLNQIIDSKQLENDPNLAVVYNCLGTIHARQALYGEALEYYRKALNTQARVQFSNNNALAEIFNNIGQTHLGLNQLMKPNKIWKNIDSKEKPNMHTTSASL
jgi:tetratricopeptide (TPR) repeat protein